MTQPYAWEETQPRLDDGRLAKNDFARLSRDLLQAAHAALQDVADSVPAENIVARVQQVSAMMAAAATMMGLFDGELRALGYNAKARRCVVEIGYLEGTRIAQAAFTQPLPGRPLSLRGGMRSLSRCARR